MRKQVRRWTVAIATVLTVAGVAGVYYVQRGQPGYLPGPDATAGEKLGALRTMIADPAIIPPTRAAAALALRLLERSPDEFEFFKTASGYMALTYQSGSPKDRDTYDIIQPRADQAIAMRRGTCGWRDMSLRRLGELIGKPDDEMRRVALMRVPLQRNHTATEIALPGLGFVFFDPSFGVYFTTPEGRPLSLADARWRFPDVIMHYVDTGQGRYRTHGVDIPFERIIWRATTGRDLMAERMPCWYLGPTSKNVRKNCDVLRTYFASEVTPDRQLIFRNLAFNDGDTLNTAEIEHYLPGFVGLRITIPPGFAHAVLRLDGAGLGRFLVDYDDFDPRFFARGFDVVGIESLVSDDGNARTLRFQTGGKGGVLSLIPTHLGDARIETLALSADTGD